MFNRFHFETARQAIPLAFLLCIAMMPASAQPKRPEVFGLAGFARAVDDEGSLGTGLATGGAVTLPFARRWAIDLDVNHLRTNRDVGQGFKLQGRRTHITPAVQYRRGNEERVYGFVSFGIGATVARDGGNFIVSRPLETTTGPHFQGKGGFVTVLNGRVLLRAEMFTIFSFQHLSPDLGARVGVGYRF